MPIINNGLTAKIHQMTSDQLLKELQRLSKLLNLRLRALEKKDLQTTSKFYIDAAEARKRGVSYMRYTKKGEMKYQTDFRGMSRAQKSDLLKKYYSYADYETGTVKGTRIVQAKRIAGVKSAVLERAQDRQLSPEILEKLDKLPANRYNEIAATLRERNLISQYDSGMATVIADLIDKSDQQIINIIDKFTEFVANAPYGEVAFDDKIDFFKTSTAAFDAL